MSADARLAEESPLRAPRFDRCEVGGRVLLGVSAIVDDPLEPTTSYVVVSGVICAGSASTLAAMLDGVISDGITDLHVDLSSVELCTSHGVDALEDARHRLEARQGSMRIAGARGVVRRVLDVLGVEVDAAPAAGSDGQALHR